MLLHQHVNLTKLEVLKQLVINALLVELVKSQIKQEAIVLLRDQLVDVLNMY